MDEFPEFAHTLKSTFFCSAQSNLDYPDSLGLDEIVRIIENIIISEEQKLIKLGKQHLILNQNIYKSKI